MNIGVTSPHVLIRKSLSALLGRVPGVKVVFDLDSLLDDLELVRRLKPNILLIDAVSPSVDLKVLGQATTLVPEAKVLLLSEDADETRQLESIRQGAYGFISKNCDPETLEKALKLVSKGEVWISHRVVSRLVGTFVRGRSSPGGDRNGLTRREQEILALLADGCSNKEIASTLCVSEHTVRAHLTSLYKKIPVTSRLEAALYYFERARQSVEPLVVAAGSDPDESEAAPAIGAAS